MQAFNYCKVQRYNRKRIRKRWPLFLSAIIAVLTLFLLHLKYNINPLLTNLSKNEATSKVLTSFNSAAKETLSSSFDYNSFVEVVKDSQDNIILIYTNSALINVFSRSLAINAQEKIDKLDNHANVPLGAFSGFAIFSGLGKPIKINIKQIGTVKTNFESKFESAGINQTLHRIYLATNIDIMLILPGKDYSFTVSEQILLCESVIIGKVPSIYFQNG